MVLPRWFPLARNEARTILTSKGAWGLGVLVLLWGYRPTYNGWEALGADVTIGFVQISTGFIFPLGVLLLSYRSVVAERTSGSLKFVLGLPLTRTEILVGKVLGRSAGIAVPVCLAAVALGVGGLVRFGLFSPLVFLAVLAATVFYVVVLVSLATAVSAVTTSTVRATSVLFGLFYLGQTFIWDAVATPAYTWLTGRAVNPFDPPADGLLFLLHRLWPGDAYNVLTNWFLGVGNSGAFFNSVITKLQPRGQIAVYVVEATFEPAEVPLYLHELSGFAILCAWIVVPLGLARYRFERGDLV